MLYFLFEALVVSRLDLIAIRTPPIAITYVNGITRCRQNDKGYAAETRVAFYVSQNIAAIYSREVQI